MIIETLATGNEVVTGDVVDKNSADVSAQLWRLGFFVSRHTALPDDRKLLAEGILQISHRADICIATGGLGPTEDDLTTEVLSELLSVKLIRNEEAVQNMQARFNRAGVRMSSNNLKSADLPEGAEVFQNARGTAPGFSIQINRCKFFFFPGVPFEFHYFLETAFLPYISQFEGQFAYEQLKTIGVPESHLAEKFQDYAQLFPKVEVGYRAHGAEVWLKLMSRGKNIQEAKKELEPAVNLAVQRLGASCFGQGNDDLIEQTHQKLLSSNLKIGFAESCTGGAVSQVFTALSGASQYFNGSVVCYSNEVKQKVLGVHSETLTKFSAVSMECAFEMAEAALKVLDVDLAISITGIAGPGGGTPEKPVGLVYFGMSYKANGKTNNKKDAPPITQVFEKKFRGERSRVQRQSVVFAVDLVRRHLNLFG